MKNNLKKNFPTTLRKMEFFAKRKAKKGTFNWLNAAAENGIFVKLDMDEMVLRRYLNERLFISSGD